MTDTHFIINPKSEMNPISFIAPKSEKTMRLTLMDGMFIVIFLTIFVGLIFVLAR